MFNALLIGDPKPSCELDVKVVEIFNSIRIFHVLVVFFKLIPITVNFTALFTSTRDVFATMIIETTLIYVGQK